jgi:hypothetical protein
MAHKAVEILSAIPSFAGLDASTVEGIAQTAIRRSYDAGRVVFQKDSPSSGLFRVKVYNEHGMAQKDGTGMFPRQVMNHFPLLPLEEEGRLNDMPLRENFVERVFAYYRWTEMLDKEPTPGGLVPTPSAKDRQVPHRPQADAHGPQSEALHRDGPSRRRRRQAGLGRIDSRVWGHAHGGPERAES